MVEFLFHISFVGYTVGLFLYLGYTFTRKESLSTFATWILFTSVIVQVIDISLRLWAAHQVPHDGYVVPWSNWHDSFSFFALVITIEFLIIMAIKPLPILGSFVSPLAWVSMVIALSSPFERQLPTMSDAFQSHWMLIHIPLIFMSYAAFANAFGVGLAYLIQERTLKSKSLNQFMFRLPSLDELDDIIFKIIAAAFPLLTLGLIVGSAWAYDAWGRFWGWDPKETWALITWLIYLIYLFVRIVLGWRGRKTAYLSIIGFVVALFTYIGVNYFSDLHGGRPPL